MIMNGRAYDLAQAGVQLGMLAMLAAQLWLGLYAVPYWRRRDQHRRVLRSLRRRDDYGRPVA